MRSAHRSDRPSSLLAMAVVVLLGIGLASSIYLTHLYVQVVQAMRGGSVDSFCNISEGVNCEAVAASEFSSFLGIPISVYGLQYFGIALVLVLAAHFRVLPVCRWDSLLFALSCTGVPVTLVLGWISVTLIESVCIMCVTVYVVNTILVVLLGIPNRKRLGIFFQEGLSELVAFAFAGKRRVASAAATLLLLSQFFWIPQIVAHEEPIANNPTPIVPTNDTMAGTWAGQPVSCNTLGPVDAPIRIEEFTDFQCPFCGRAHEAILEVVKRYPGKIHLVHRDFPLDHQCNPSIKSQFHPDACAAARFARCAAEQDSFWPYEAMLFHNQRKLKNDYMLEMADQVGLDLDKMKACVVLESTHEAVLADIREGVDRNFSGTPTFVVNGELIVGARPIEFWDEKIRFLLGEKPGT